MSYKLETYIAQLSFSKPNRDRPCVFFSIIYTAPTTAISPHRSPHRQSVKENLPISQSNGDCPRGTARLRQYVNNFKTVE
ncbi:MULTISPECIES: hypothetical protein [unclassified Scytonema]|uniref:hypothetical protein n=1 Tax=unclassified Scytonema TaxID=2618749 RepID=UPI0011610B8D|nr:hypothetical protein [Scytonema sp. HK-05]